MSQSVLEKTAATQEEAKLLVQRVVLHDHNGQLTPWLQCHAKEWQHAWGRVRDKLIEFGVSTGGVVQVNLDPFLRLKGDKTKLICDYDTLRKAVHRTVEGLMFYEEPETPLFARTVANALESKLSKIEDSSVHWCQAAGSEVSWEPPRLIFPTNGYLTYAVQDGYSEGSLVIVGEVPTRGNGFYHPLLVCKFLCGIKKAFGEAKHVMEFLENMNPAEMLALQNSKHA